MRPPQPPPHEPHRRRIYGCRAYAGLTVVFIAGSGEDTVDGAVEPPLRLARGRGPRVERTCSHASAALSRNDWSVCCWFATVAMNRAAEQDATKKEIRLLGDRKDKLVHDRFDASHGSGDEGLKARRKK